MKNLNDKLCSYPNRDIHLSSQIYNRLDGQIDVGILIIIGRQRRRRTEIYNQLGGRLSSQLKTNIKL